jgi:peptide/nickel transport system substrate-binding protein
MATYAGDEVGTYKTNLDKAKSLLQQAGVGPITVDLAVRQSRLEDQQAAVFIQSNLREIGITVNIQKLPDAEFSDKLNKKQLPMFIHDWYSWGEDPFYQMTNLVKSGAFTNFTAYQNPELDALIKQGTFELDPAKRAEISKKCQEILFRDAPMAYLYSPDWTVAARSNIAGVTRDFTQIVRFDQLTEK